MRGDSWDEANDLIWAPGGAYTYDGAGNLSTGPGGAYTYDGAGNLSSGLRMTHNFKNQMDSVTRAGATLAMDYADATSDRRTGITSDETKLRLSYNQLGLEAQGPNSGDPHASWWNRDPEGTLVSQMDRVGGGARVGRYYYLFDGLGSVVGLTDHDGNLVRSYRYEPYGKQLSPTLSTTDDNPWRYAAGHYDKTTGMPKFGTRYYMPELARWTQKDPENGQLTDPMSLNAYGYVGGNPANVTDPTGRDFWSVLNDIFEGGEEGFAKGASIGGAGGCAIGALPSAGFGCPGAAGVGAAVGGTIGFVEGALLGGIWGDRQ